MKLYYFKKDTCELDTIGDAQLDPEETRKAGVPKYLIPPTATNIVPPEAKEGYARCFNTRNLKWEYVEDFRGQTVWKKEDGKPFVVDFLGKVPASVYLTEEPIQANKLQEWNPEKAAYDYPELNMLKANVKLELDSMYEDKQKIPHRVNEFWVQTSWHSIYTSTYVAMKDDMELFGGLTEPYKVLLITNPLTAEVTQIEITDINQFLPYFREVKKQFKQLAEDYHARIQVIYSSTDKEEIANTVLKY